MQDTIWIGYAEFQINMMPAGIKRRDVFPHGFLTQKNSIHRYNEMPLASLMQAFDKPNLFVLNVDQQLLQGYGRTHPDRNP